MTSNGGRSFDKIMDDIRQSTFSFHQPADLIILLGYSVNLYAAIRIAIESGIFRQLAAVRQPVTAGDLSHRLDGVPKNDTEEAVAEREEYVTRMCRAVSGMNLIDEVGPAKYQANDLTLALV